MNIEGAEEIYGIIKRRLKEMIETLVITNESKMA